MQAGGSQQKARYFDKRIDVHRDGMKELLLCYALISYVFRVQDSDQMGLMADSSVFDYRSLIAE